MLPSRNRPAKSLISALLLVLASSAAHAAEGGIKQWVQAVETDLKAEPNMSAPAVTKLKRGAQVAVNGNKDFWMKVKAGQNEGWISKLFLTDHPPVGNADLSKEVKTSMEKTTRRRSSSYAVSASTRGLQADHPGRGHGAEGKVDYEAVKAMEQLKIEPARLQAFMSSARSKPE